MTEDQKEKLYEIIARIVTDIDRGTFEESAELEAFVDELVQAAYTAGARVEYRLWRQTLSSEQHEERDPLIAKLIEAASTYDSYLAKELADELKAKP